MPELPEIETVLRTLAPAIVGRRVVAVRVRERRLRGGVAPAFAGKPILTAEQVEDVVAYLMTLRETSTP